MVSTSHVRPDYGGLYQLAAGQQGLFTAKQAASAGYSAQLLRHHVAGGRMARIQRGVYRLVHFPAGEHEDLVAVWLWSGQIGVFSHATALALHQLSDVLPHKIHLSVPQSWALRRVSIPPAVSLHHAEVPMNQRSWFGPVPVTSVRRTLSDCAQARLSPELLQQALRQARQRGLLSADECSAIAVGSPGL